MSARWTVSSQCYTGGLNSDVTGLIVNQSIEEKAVIALKVKTGTVAAVSSLLKVVAEGEERVPGSDQRGARLTAWWLVSGLLCVVCVVSCVCSLCVCVCVCGPPLFCTVR